MTSWRMVRPLVEETAPLSATPAVMRVGEGCGLGNAYRRGDDALRLADDFACFADEQAA